MMCSHRSAVSTISRPLGSRLLRGSVIWPERRLDDGRTSRAPSGGWRPKGRWFKSSRPDYSEARFGSGFLASAPARERSMARGRVARAGLVPRVRVRARMR
jgi:hypothetical protein